MNNSATPLSLWNMGDEGVIEGILGTDHLSARLREVGAIPGARVRVLRSRCPLVIQVETSRFCLRKADAACIKGKKAA